jgi:hypothetical protein
MMPSVESPFSKRMFFFEAIILAIALLHLAVLRGFWGEIGGEKVYDSCGLANGDFVLPILVAGAASVLLAYTLHFIKGLYWLVAAIAIPWWVLPISYVCLWGR